jgi:hypothetical protein
MKKTYSAPEMEMKIFSTEDIVRTSIQPGENELPPIFLG